MQEGTTEFAAVIGLDWADKKHDVCIRAQGADELERGVVQHRPVALQDWVEGLRRGHRSLVDLAGVQEYRHTAPWRHGINKTLRTPELRVIRPRKRCREKVLR